MKKAGQIAGHLAGAAKSAAGQVAVKAVGWAFGKWMDSIEARRPNGLVARFRKTVGRLTPS